MNNALLRFLLTVLALLLPPVAVFAKAGSHWQLYLNLFFCVTGYIPAVVHAVWFVNHQPRPPAPDDDEQDYIQPAKEKSDRGMRVEPRLNW